MDPVLLAAVAQKARAARRRSVQFLTSGAFTVPAGVQALDLFLVAGGGGGGWGTLNTSGFTGAQGGNGGVVRKFLKQPVNPGQVLVVTIGAGGTGGSSSSGGQYGGPTSVASPSPTPSGDIYSYSYVDGGVPGNNSLPISSTPGSLAPANYRLSGAGGMGGATYNAGNGYDGHNGTPGADGFGGGGGGGACTAATATARGGLGRDGGAFGACANQQPGTGWNNTGGGGGGGTPSSTTIWSTGGPGGSGIAIISWWETV